MVAVGNLHKVWLTVPENVTEEELKVAFKRYFGVECADVLSVSDKSFSYCAPNNAYFTVCDLQPVKGLTLEQLLKNRTHRPPNIIVS